MNTQEQIEAYVAGQPEPKRADLRALHQAILRLMPDARLWFLDGRDDSGKVVSNPNIGYGSYVISYAGGKTREFYQLGLSANTTGISVYVMGIEDRKRLSHAYGQRLGKASVSGYCIKFRRLADIDLAVLQEAMRDGIAATGKR